MRPRHLLLLALLTGLVPALGAGPARGAPLDPALFARAGSGTVPRVAPEPPMPARLPGLAGAAATAGRRWTGHPRVLVLLVDFPDRPADREAHSPAYFERLLFSTGELPAGSLREYYREASYGRMDVTGEVKGWFRAPRPYLDYLGDYNGLCRACTPHNARTLAGEVIALAEEAGVDFTRFDDNGPDGIPASGDDDGTLDGLLIVYAGWGAERTGLATDLRSHYWDTPGPERIQGIYVPDYAMIPELDNVGVAVHEFGHVLGAEDLYDTSGRGGGLGWYSVMAYGMWLQNAERPGGPDPFTRIQWGFVEPENLGADEPDLLVPAVNDTPVVMRLWTKGESGPEYFLLENRRPEGIDRYLPGDGLLVYHVDETRLSQNDGGHYRVGLVQADGLRSLEGGLPRNLGDPGDFFPGTTGARRFDDDTVPSARSYSGEPSRVALSEIGDPGPVVSLRAGVGRYLAGGPLPRVELIPDDEEPPPSAAYAFRVRVANDGTRLRGGTLTASAREPGVDLAAPYTSLLEPVPALGSADAAPLALRLDAAAAGGAPAVVEFVLDTGNGAFTLSAPVPSPGARRVHETFDADRATVRVEAVTEGAAAGWRRTADPAGTGEKVEGVGPYPAGTDGALILGPYDLHGAAVLRFRQWTSLRSYGDVAVHGGFLEVSGDGGDSWRELTPYGGYPYRLAFSQGNPYPGRPAWGGRRRAWEEVAVPVTGLDGAVLFRFHFVSDYLESLSGDGWWVDDVRLWSWTDSHAVWLEEPPPPPAAGGALRLPFAVLPVLPGVASREVRLVRERRGESLVLATRRVQDAGEGTFVVNDLDPGAADRFRLEWGNPPGLSSREVQIGSAPGGPETLLPEVPSVVRREAGAWITYRVPGAAPARVRLAVFDVEGRRVALLADGLEGPGERRALWAGFGEGRRPAAGGVYFVHIRVGGRTETRRVVLMP